MPTQENNDSSLALAVEQGNWTEDNNWQDDSAPSRDEVIDEEKGHVPSSLPPTVGFFDAGLAETRKHVFKWTIGQTLILFVAILCFISFYWGANFRVEQNMHNLNIWVVDFDAQVAPYTDVEPMVGPLITKVAQELRQPVGTVGWEARNASDFNYDPIAVREDVFQEKCWGAVIINANATALLNAAVQNGNTSYDPYGAAQFIIVQARDQTAMSSYIMPQMNILATAVIQAMSKTWTPQVLEMAVNSTRIATHVEHAPQVLTPAIEFTMINLRPFTPPDAVSAVMVALIYLIITAFFSFMFFFPFHMKFMAVPSPGRRPMKIPHLLVWRWLATVAVYFFLSLAYSFVALAFQINFTAPPGPHTEPASPATGFGHASFFIYWMMNWLGMCAMGLACENMAMLLGMPWTAFWLLFWIISNVSTGFYPLALSPGFYKWGEAWPLHNLIEATRTIMFDTNNYIGKNVGILLAWLVVDTMLFPVCALVMGKKMRWEKKREAKFLADLEERRTAFDATLQ